jgi:hypothetical protein
MICSGEYLFLLTLTHFKSSMEVWRLPQGADSACGISMRVNVCEMPASSGDIDHFIQISSRLLKRIIHPERERIVPAGWACHGSQKVAPERW